MSVAYLHIHACYSYYKCFLCNNHISRYIVVAKETLVVTVGNWLIPKFGQGIQKLSLIWR